MGKGRYIYQNLITTESMITVDDYAAGYVSNAQKDGSGVAMGISGGAYNAATEKEYICRIDNVAAGKEIGQATFKWSDDGGATWPPGQSGIATSASPISLNSGVNINWIAGT